MRCASVFGTFRETGHLICTIDLVQNDSRVISLMTFDIIYVVCLSMPLMTI
jgi:hypothetical protein